MPVNLFLRVRGVRLALEVWAKDEEDQIPDHLGDIFEVEDGSGYVRIIGASEVAEILQPTPILEAASISAD
jgi:hypothetical protein